MSRLVALSIAFALVGLVAGPLPTRANDVQFEQPTAEATLGLPITFETTFTASARPERVEVLISTPGDAMAVSVVPAVVTPDGGGWHAIALLEGHLAPNTTFEYRFRARDADGGIVLGPASTVTVTDDRFDWRILEGSLVRLHWYEGGDDFARRARDIGDDALARASEFLGVTESEPVDFFIYSSEIGLFGALGPGAREWAGGKARTDIRTMFGLIEPAQVNADWVEIVVRHELAHLVFHTATDNPFHRPPSWLDEGIAVYLAEGYTRAHRATVERAAASGDLMPLEALAGQFPTQLERARLAYAQSASATDFFVTTYGAETLRDLVRSYADGVSDDEAFLAATGADAAAFDVAWMGSLGVQPPVPYGPQPGEPGPVPADWADVPQPSPGAVPPTPAVPGATTPPDGPLPGTPDGGDDRPMILAVLGGMLLALAGVLALLLVRVSRTPRDRPPPANPPG